MIARVWGVAQPTRKFLFAKRKPPPHPGGLPWSGPEEAQLARHNLQ